MEPKNKFSLLIQQGSNGNIFRNNRPEAWQIYGEKPSFRSFISGNVLIMDRDFYEQLPFPLKPIPCTEKIIIEKGSLQSALHDIVMKPGKKYYIVGSPSLYFQSQPKEIKDCIEECLVMKMNILSNGSLSFYLSDKDWNKKTLQAVSQDRHQPISMEFIHYTRKIA